MADATDPIVQTLTTHDGLLTVVVNLSLPPWPAPAAPTAPDLPAMPDPMPPAPPAPPMPAPVAPPAPPSKPVSLINRILRFVRLELSDNARWFYKQVQFWIWAVVIAAPDIYNAAVSNHVIAAGHAPPLLERFFNLIGFIGAATLFVKAKKKIQDG